LHASLPKILMFTLPESIEVILAPFMALFAERVWCHAEVLIIGTILTQGKRTVTQALRVMGLGGEQHYINYHRVLSRAKWSSLAAAKILLGMLIAVLSVNSPILIGIDETIERRKGEKIKAKGIYRDAVRSTKKQVVKCFGLKWIVMMLLVQMPWNQRVWALPFLSILAPSERANLAAKRRHKTIIDWAKQMVKQVSRWLKRKWVCIGDGSYACVSFAWVCAQQQVTLISRLRLDAQLHDFPSPQPPHKRGKKPLKGNRLATLQSLVTDPTQVWQTVALNWYGNQPKFRQILTGVCLWYTSAETPIPIRWVLVIDPDGKHPPAAFFSTDLHLEATVIVEWFILRWGVEVTFEEARAHLGVETQRQWSDLAIARTTPTLFGLFSLLCLIALHLPDTATLISNSSAWYVKAEATFSDVLSLVRRHLWHHRYFKSSTQIPDSVLFSSHEWNTLLNHLVAIS
jgi:hypothetical protein